MLSHHWRLLSLGYRHAQCPLLLSPAFSSPTSLAHKLLSLDTRRLHTTPRQSKALTIWEDLSQLKRSPAPAMTLGLAGLIPFAAAPLYMSQLGIFVPEVATAQMAYGATILSFLGEETELFYKNLYMTVA